MDCNFHLIDNCIIFYLKTIIQLNQLIIYKWKLHYLRTFHRLSSRGVITCKTVVDRSPYPYKRKGFRVKIYEKDVLFRGWNWAMRICESVARFDSSSCKKVEGIGGGSSYVVALCIPNYRKQSNRSIIWFYMPFIGWLNRIIFADVQP